MFFLFLTLIILLISGLAIYTSRVGVEIQNLIIDTEKPKGEKINKDSKIYVYILIFRKIKMFKKNVRNMDGRNIKFQNKQLDIKFLKDRDVKIDYKDLLQQIDIYFEEIDLSIRLGTEDAALTAILTGIIGAALGVIIRRPRYEIIPIYANKNFVKIKLDCIFSVHLMQYIYKVISNKTSSNKIIADKKFLNKNFLNKTKKLGKENIKKKVEV